MQHITQDSTSKTCLWPSKQVWQILFSKKMPTIFFSSKNILGNHNVPGQQNTYITIFSDQNAFISSPSYFFYTPIILFYQNLQRFKVYKIICGKATSLSRDNKIMSRDRWNFYFELKVPWNGIDSQNFAQDPAGPIWTALYRYIYPEIYFTTTETHFFRQQYTVSLCRQ